LAYLARDGAICTAIAAAGAIAPLMVLAGNGTVCGQVWAAQALSNLAVIDLY